MVITPAPEIKQRIVVKAGILKRLSWRTLLSLAFDNRRKESIRLLYNTLSSTNCQGKQYVDGGSSRAGIRLVFCTLKYFNCIYSDLNRGILMPYSTIFKEDPRYSTNLLLLIRISDIRHN